MRWVEGLILGCALLPLRAEACSANVWVDGLIEIRPRPCETLPAGSPIRVMGRSLEADQFDLQVDGAPRAFRLEEAPGFTESFTGLSYELMISSAIYPDPPTEPGDWVTLRWTNTSGRAGFESQRRHWTAGRRLPVLQMDRGPLLSIDRLQVPNRLSTCEHDRLTDLYFFSVHVDTTLAEADRPLYAVLHHLDEDGRWVPSMSRPVAGLETLLVRSLFPATPSPENARRYGSVTPGPTCWRAEVVDPALGHRVMGEPVCALCRDRIEPRDERALFEETWFESQWLYNNSSASGARPPWSPEDMVEGGHCIALVEAAESAASTPPEVTCRPSDEGWCQIRPQTPAMGWVGAILVLVLTRVRRCRSG